MWAKINDINKNEKWESRAGGTGEEGEGTKKREHAVVYTWHHPQDDCWLIDWKHTLIKLNIKT